ncbi:hypothetical protein EI555_003773 [Monodon monoceros]|uniref:Cytochrome b-c1 complex subunit 10 n=1 Tax=Monodon monoceros TaxID=40151 RepID=A0A4U1F2Z8_MONMO|nr:hypothetical protein EI555_003773 [Monodon monoceros]
MLERFVGPRYRQLARNCLGWGGSGHTTGRVRPDPRSCRLPTVGMWGTVGAMGLVWATDWRLILDWVPYINGKFKKDD